MKDLINSYNKSTKLRFLKIYIAQLLLIILLFSVVSVGTIAFVTNITVPITNTFSFGRADVKITESGVNSNEVAWGMNTKKVVITISEGNIRGVVRAIVVPILKTGTGEIIGQQLLDKLSAPVSNIMVMGDITLCFDTDWETYWFYKNGYFYYKEILEPSEPAEHLLTGIILTNPTAEKIAEYQNITVEIEVMADMIQSIADAPSVWGVIVESNGAVHD